MVDICITATLRPEILKRTLVSFRIANSFDLSKYKAILNIDCSPKKRLDCDADVVEILDLTKYYFKIRKYRIVPYNQASFSLATKWCWENTVSKYVYNIEDDWYFVKKFSIDRCIKLINSEYDMVRLSQKKKPFLTKEERNKITLAPSLWRGDILRNFAKKINKHY